MDTINAEVLTLTYGSIVRQLIADYDDVDEVNKQLEKMGFNIGQRLIDEFLAKSKTQKCSNFREAAERIKQAFKMFLNITATITDWSDEDPSHPQCSITLEDNPLADFVELPENLATLRYCSILSGAVRGALEMVNMEVECAMIGEKVRGDDGDVMRVKFKRADTESYPFRDDD